VTGYRRRIFAADDRGMALLITIMILSLLIVVTLEFGKSMRQHHLAAANLKGGEQLAAIARSGISVAKALLEQDGKGTPGDTFFDEWATLAQADLSGLFNEGSLRLTVSDLSGRVQINSLAKSGAVGIGTRQILNRLLISGDFAIKDEPEARAIVNSLVDWIDTDDQELDFGAENSYYRSLSPAYGSRNGPVQFIEELLLVKGVTPDLLYGTADKKALVQFITVHGDDGKINLNTAGLEVLRAMNPQLTRELALKMDDFRRDKENLNLLASPGWYTRVLPGDVDFDLAFLTTASRYFSIEAEGNFDTLKRRIVSVVSRENQGKIIEMTRKVE
jgi:general secretion pathway protein K